MTIKAVTPVPPRIAQDIQDNGARNLRLFLENVRERLNDLNASVVTVNQTIAAGSTTTVSSSSSDALVYAIALGGP